jgi:hypothetical protein
MPISRYDERLLAFNDHELYKGQLKKRNIKFINQYVTPTFKKINEEDMQFIDLVEYVWGNHDRFWKLASDYYQDPTLWWLIAKFNNKPTENHISLGETIYIPTPMESALQLYEE